MKRVNWEKEVNAHCLIMAARVVLPVYWAGYGLSLTEPPPKRAIVVMDVIHATLIVRWGQIASNCPTHKEVSAETKQCPAAVFPKT